MKSNVILFALIAIIFILVGGFALSKEAAKNTTKSDEILIQQDTYGNGMGNRERGGLNNQKTQLGMQGGQGQPNRGNCLADDCLLISDMEYPAGELSQEVQNALIAAINDEYKALSTYNAVVQEFGSIRPFSMIIGAEEQHIASLKSIFNKYGLEIPANTYASNVDVPGTVKEACQVGVDAEIANAELYKEELLPAVSEYEDITGVFTNLMNASQQKHLPAFERCN